MIQHLSIRNLILIEQADIPFGTGLNIITGETGAGKSAILSGIRLILGERADLDLIRKGADLAIVEALVNGLLIRREIHRSKPSRSFINDELVSLQLLRETVSSIELVDQSKAQDLPKNQLHYLDTFAKIDNGGSCKTLRTRKTDDCGAPCQSQLADSCRSDECPPSGVGEEERRQGAPKRRFCGCGEFCNCPNDFALEFSRLQTAEKRVSNLLALKQSEPLEILQEELDRIEEIAWKSEEEERLTTEHHILTHAQELLEKISFLTTHLSELASLKRCIFSLESFPSLEECTEWLKTGFAHLDEANRFLLSYEDQLEANPNQLFFIEKRLGQIESLKRKWGTYAEVEKRKAFLQEKIETLSMLDLDLETAQKELAAIQQHTLLQAASLTERRKEAARQFSKAIVAELIHLNLPEAQILIEIKPKQLSSQGADEIHFLFAANPGAPLLPTHQCASGGELSRLLFAIKTVLAGKENNCCLIFDEIDGNIGGKTASILGIKLQEMAAYRQLIAITHFVQVARYANDHFLVTKSTTPLGAKTMVNKLDMQTRTEEYTRMTGGLL